MNTPAELLGRADALSRDLTDALQVHEQAATDAARAEHVYRLSRAQAWAGTTTIKLAKHREDHVNAATAPQRQDRDLAAALAKAAYERIRARQTQISLIQSELNAVRSELDLAGRVPGGAP